MQVLYYYDQLPQTLTKSIFLAGPTYRGDKSKSWRKEALLLLEELKYDGVVIIPEPQSDIIDDKLLEYNTTVEWERKMINACDIILFWIPRSDELPGFTTNIEYGNFINSQKIVVGSPIDAPKVRYLQSMANELKMPWFDTLKDTLSYACNLIGEGAKRSGEEVIVPLNIYLKQEFQDWYKSHKNQGNELRDFKVLYAYRKSFIWLAHAKVYIEAEDRIKENEIVISRTSIANMVLYCKEEKKVVLIKEFRTPVSNKESFVYEIAGGSIEGEDIKSQAIVELKEETGIEINENDVVFVGERQISATLCLHKAYLYASLISKEQLENIDVTKYYGNFDVYDSEKTYISIKSISEILKEEIVDWSNIGMILSAVEKLDKI